MKERANGYVQRSALTMDTVTEKPWGNQAEGKSVVRGRYISSREPQHREITSTSRSARRTSRGAPWGWVCARGRCS